MSTIFADTSAVAKRYIAETSSTWVKTWIRGSARNLIVISELAIVETFSVLARRGREGKLTSSELTQIRTTLLRHAARQYLVIPLDSPLVTPARRLVTKYPLRTLDAIQLATALQATKNLQKPMTFMSADKNLLAAAAAEGFQIDDPTAHP